MEIQLSEHFNYKKLFKFTFPSIIMMIFTSVYGVVDGIFVSNFVGKTAFTAVNFAMPLLMILGVFGFMFGTGGSAIIAKTMGEGKPEEAKKQFSMLVYASLILGIVQYTTSEICRRRRCCSIRCCHVYQYDFPCCVYRLLHRNSTDCQLPLRSKQLW